MKEPSKKISSGLQIYVKLQQAICYNCEAKGNLKKTVPI